MSTTIHPLLFHGTLLNQYGDALLDAKIQLWQTDLNGNYLHSSRFAAVNSEPLDEQFQYFGTDSTDSNGNFEFLTYRPGIYPNRPYSHFHFKVWLDGEDPSPALVTQFYFADEGGPFPEVLQLDVVEVDGSVYNYGSYVNGTIIVEDDSSSSNALLATSPTQPEGPFYPETDFFSMDNDLTTKIDTAQTTNPTAPAYDDDTQSAATDTTVQSGAQVPETTTSSSTTMPATETATAGFAGLWLSFKLLFQ
mgnify:CR=1 FL=1